MTINELLLRLGQYQAHHGTARVQIETPGSFHDINTITQSDDEPDPTIYITVH